MKQSRVEISANVQLSKSIFRMELVAPEAAAAARPGQFLMVQASDDGYDPLLRRPFSIHNVTSSGEVHIAYKVIGRGTELMSRMAAGGTIDIVGPQGNGFTVNGKHHFIVGGGMGIAPMQFLTKKIVKEAGKPKVHILLGARDKAELEAFNEYYNPISGVDVRLATDDGSFAHHGLVTDLLREAGGEFGAGQHMVYCCGPHPMMKAVATLSRELGWGCQVSLETMMACGIAACLGCTVESTKLNSKGGAYLHVCQDGPVFNEGDIKW
nr:dihydroorotate dehydrogenase electron transfer subunit [Desulfobulbaceae bacterium]